MITEVTNGNRALLASGTEDGNLLQVPAWLDKVEGTRAGRRFCAVVGNGATFLAPVTAWPTTAFTMALYNPHENDKVFFVDTVFSFLASGTPDQNGALLAAVTTVSQARPTLSTGQNGGYASTVVSGLSGKGSGATRGVFINAITITGPQPAWFVAAAQPGSSTGATIASHAVLGKLEGGVAVPPGYMLGLTELGGAGTTPLFGFGVIWDELAVKMS